MAVWHSVMAVGAINTSASHTVEQNFATPRSVWSYTMLHDVLVYDTDGRANARIIKVVDDGATKNVNWVGFFGSKVTKIVYRLSVEECYARASGVVHY